MFANILRAGLGFNSIISTQRKDTKHRVEDESVYNRT